MDTVTDYTMYPALYVYGVDDVAELGGAAARHRHIHPRHHPLDPGGASRQLRDHQDPPGPRRHPTHAARRQVTIYQTTPRSFI